VKQGTIFLGRKEVKIHCFKNDDLIFTQSDSVLNQSLNKP